MRNKLTKPQKTLILCSIFIAGSGAAIIQPLIYSYFIFFILFFLILFLTYKKNLSWKFIFFSILILFFSIFYANLRTPLPDGLYSLAPAEITIKGKVISEPRGDLKGKTKFHFKVNKLLQNKKWLPFNSKTIVYIYDKYRKFDEIKIGDIIELTGSVNPPYKATNPGEFDYRKYLAQKGVFTMTFVRYDNYEIKGNSGINTEFFLRKLNSLRKNILDEHRNNLESPKIELLGGMVFGDHAVPVPAHIEKSFIKSGLLHLLAASGLNVGIIFGVWFFIASRLKTPFRIKIITGMFLVAVYSLLTGLPPSVTRAALMLEFVLLGKLMDRQAENHVLLVLVGALMILFNPLMISNISFQLSFIVTLGLLLFVPVLVEKSKPVPEFLSGAVWVPLVAQVFVAPIQAFHFNTFAPYSLFANILVIPFVGIISFSGFVGSIFALFPLIGEKICFITDKISEPFISLLLFISNYTADLPGSLLYVSKPDFVFIILFYFMLFIVLTGLKNNFSLKKYNKTALVIFLTLLVLFFKGNFIFNKNLEFLFFDVGEGDSVLIKTPEKKYILIDTGPYHKYSPAKTAIIPYLRDKGIKNLDAVVLTHPDSDHTGGTTYILENIGVKKLFSNGEKRKSKNYLFIQDSIKKNNIKTGILSDNDILDIDKRVKIKVIRPKNTDRLSDNEDGLVLYITYKNFSALLMADCEADSINKLKETIKHPVDLLKVGHHGSYNSVNKTFMEYMKPKFSVISVGRKGYHQNHPHPEVIKTLKTYNSKFFRTDRDYAVKFITDGEKIKYITFNMDIRMD